MHGTPAFSVLLEAQSSNLESTQHTGRQTKKRLFTAHSKMRNWQVEGLKQNKGMFLTCYNL